MHLDWKTPVRRLDPVSPPDSGYFVRESPLRRCVTYVLDYGVAENDIEGSISKRQHPAVTRDLIYAFRSWMQRSWEVQECEIRLDRRESPDRRRPADIEDASAIRDLKRSLKESHPLRTKMSKELFEQGGVAHVSCGGAL